MLLTIINDILDFSKIEAGKLQLEALRFAPADVAGEVVKVLSLSAHEKGLKLQCDVEPDVTPELVGDPGRLR